MDVALELGRCGKSVEVHDSKGLHCSEQTMKGGSDENLGRKEESSGDSLSVLREDPSRPEQDVGRNMDAKGHSVGSHQMDMRDLVLDHGGKAMLFIQWQRTWATLCSCSSVLWKVELARDGIEH